MVLTAALENSLSVLTTHLNNPPPRNVSKRSKDICPLKELYVNVHSRFIHKGQKLLTTQMSFSG